MTEKQEGKLYLTFVRGDIVFDALKENTPKTIFDQVSEKIISAKKWVPDTVLDEAKAEIPKNLIIHLQVANPDKYVKLSPKQASDLLLWFQKWFGVYTGETP